MAELGRIERAGKSVTLRASDMARLSFPPPDELSPAARDVYDATAAGRRGSVPANVMVWLRSPELASRAQRLGEFLRYETTLGPRHSELAVPRRRPPLHVAVRVGDSRARGRSPRAFRLT